MGILDPVSEQMGRLGEASRSVTVKFFWNFVIRLLVMTSPS